MSRNTPFHLSVIWLVSLNVGVIGVLYPVPKEQSWRNQNLSTVPVELDTRLRALDLSNNLIRQLHTLGLPHLQRLDLSNNQLDLISEAAFVNLAQLEELNLARNALYNNPGSNSKALQSISRLRSLDISMNGLNDGVAEQYLQNKSSLDQLKLTGNSLTRLTPDLFKESRGLRSICLESNLITDIEQGTFEPLTRLETLNLAMNFMPNICDFKLPQVKYLNLSRNSIEFFVTLNDSELYMLEILDLSHNRLLYFPILPEMNHLRFLHLQNNMVGMMDAEKTLISEANSLYEELSGKGAAIHNGNVYSNWRLTPLVYVDLSSNHFKSFPLETMGLLKSLETLNFSFNCLQNIDCQVTNDTVSEYHQQHFLPSLKNFDLKSNSIERLSHVFLRALAKLETLNLQDNFAKPCAPLDPSELSKPTPANQKENMTCVDFGQIRNLKHLNLQDNGIKTLHPNTFENMALISLNLARNSDLVMRADALKGLQTSLQVLSLSEINMTSSDLSLPCMPALRHLNISNNRLHAIPNSLRCAPLRALDISNNIFVSLNHSLISEISTYLDSMFISGNYFNCCKTTWLTVLNEANIQLPDIGLSECITSDSRVLLTDFLKSPSIYCNTISSEVTFVQGIIIILFFTVILTLLVAFIKNVCCQQDSFIV